MKPLEEALGRPRIEDPAGKCSVSASRALARNASSSSSVRAVPMILQVLRKQSVGIETVERGQQHPPGQVPGRAEHHQR